MRTQIIAELATGHGGNVDLACDMVKAAAEAGADYAKIQSYTLAKLQPNDPQREWLTKAHLDVDAHARLIATCADAGIRFLSTPFDVDSLQMLRGLGQTEFKIASSESGNDWWEQQDGETWFVSYPWGRVESRKSTLTFHGSVMYSIPRPHDKLTAIPLYPTPLEAVGRATLLEGWSDHGRGIDACVWALAQGVKVLEVHITIPGSRVMLFDKTMAEVNQLRQFADACETMRSGVSTVYRERWRA